LISEYIGSSLLNGAIQFVAPDEMGCPPDSDDAVAICARLGAGDAPVDVGWFIHHIRSTQGGAEMRSRFRMGGPHIAVRKAPAVASKALRPIASRMLGDPVASGHNLLVHCAREMNHLAGFLPELYDAFGNE
jgi:DAPG hydrolase PhiG domain